MFCATYRSRCGQGELVCLVGRNGAGKTTTLRTIMGFRKPVAGTIEFEGRTILGLQPYQIARLGIGFAPEESEVFGELTVAENIAMPTWTCPRPRGRPRSASRTPIGVPELERYRDAAARRCPAASARWSRSPARSRSDRSSCCSTSRPKGCRRLSYRRSSRGSANIRAFGHAVFIAESNIHHVPDFTDRLYVIERGEIIFAGKPDEARRNPAVARIIEGTGHRRRSD